MTWATYLASVTSAGLSLLTSFTVRAELSAPLKLRRRHRGPRSPSGRRAVRRSQTILAMVWQCAGKYRKRPLLNSRVCAARRMLLEVRQHVDQCIFDQLHARQRGRLFVDQYPEVGHQPRRVRSQRHRPGGLGGETEQHGKSKAGFHRRHLRAQRQAQGGMAVSRFQSAIATRAGWGPSSILR